ncbi:hypothetical protein OT109_15105 [Phycisphaeraceae bacterium D3-23]
MPRIRLSLFALVALLCTAPLYAQADDPIVGTWTGIEMDGEEMPEGEFNITFNADGTGEFIERDGDADPFRYAHDPEVKKICTVYMEGEDPFDFEVAFDGDTMTFTPLDDEGPPPLKLRRVEGGEDTWEDMPADDLADNPMVGVWAGVTMGGEEIPEGAFTLTVNADGTGDVREGADDQTPEPYTYTYDADTGVFVVTPEVGDPFTFTMTFDGDLATMSAGDEGGPPPIVLRRIREGGGGDGAMPELADMSDSPLVGRWTLVSFNGEAMPDDTVYVFENHADGTGTSTINGEPGDPYTWQHDFETGVATFTHPDQEPAAFTFEIEDGVATYVSTDGTMTIIERRLGDDEQPNGVPEPEPEPVDMSDSPLVGLWMLIKFNDQDVPEDLVVYEHRPDGTGTVIEEGVRGDEFRWNHDVENATIVVDDAEGQRFEFTLVMQDDLVFYVSTDESMRIVHRRAGDLAAAGDEIVGTWAGIKMGNQDLEPGEFGLTFHADGTGELNDGDEENEPFTYAYNSATKLYTLQVEEEESIAFAAAFDDEELTITPVDENGPPPLVLRRVVDADDNDDENAMDADGVTGTWYAQKMTDEGWIDPKDEFRLEFRDDGTVHAFENGEVQDEGLSYTVDEDRSVIVLSIPGEGEMMDLHYEQFDDVMILTFSPPGGFNEGEMEIILCRRPEGTEAHQRERAREGAGEDGGVDGVGAAVEDAAEAVEEAVEGARE